MKPKISCVIATRDRASIISDAIQSIIDQTESDWELIIVDDHSSSDDETSRVIESFADERIKYYKLPDQNGMGIAAARNYGNIMSTAEYIAVMDSDDISYPDRFELSLAKIAETGADLVYGELDIWTPESGEVVPRLPQYSSIEFDLEVLLKRCFIPHVTCTYKRQAVLDNPYNSFFRKGEDYDLFLRLAKHGREFAFVNKPLAKYRKHADSITKKGNDGPEYDEIARNIYRNDL